MNRYYLSPIIGTGTEADPYRPKIADYGGAWAGVIPSDAAGHPVKPWCLVLVEAAGHARLLADTDLDPLPALPLDMPLTSASKPTRDGLVASLAKIAVDAPEAKTLAEVVDTVGRALDPDFRVTHLRVG